MVQLRRFARRLYGGSDSHSRRFLYFLLAFDLTSLIFIIITSFIERNDFVRALDLVFAIAFLAELLLRLLGSKELGREFLRLTTWTDVAVIVSLFISTTSEGVGFLRILRTFRLLRTFHVLRLLREDSNFFRRNEDVIIAVANLSIFIFIMTAVVYETQHRGNSEINNYADALYFTVTALTTTGFGDVTLGGTLGRLLTVVIMIFGVTLFLNLAKVLFSPTKVRFRCPTCALLRHDVDAVHCKACGTLLKIPDEGN